MPGLEKKNEFDFGGIQVCSKVAEPHGGLIKALIEEAEIKNLRVSKTRLKNEKI